MEHSFFNEINSFYMVGIGGISMNALAKYLLSQGKRVGGSDIGESRGTVELEKLGAKISYGGADSVADYQAIVYTDAIAYTDAHLAEARALNKIIIPRGELLKQVSENYKTVIAVAGCHGKTTCTAMLAHIFDEAGKKFAAHIGGYDNKFSNFYSCGNDYFITEACEYKKNFLRLDPDIAVVLNEGEDHLECYGSREKLLEAYDSFLNKAERAVCLEGLFGGVTFGLSKSACFHAENIQENGGEFAFDVFEHGKNIGNIKLGVYGRHNILNALAALAVARMAGIETEPAIKAISKFGGVERRFEDIGQVSGARCIADYAHHPDEIAASIAAAEQITSGRLITVFQPHTYSRTKNLFGEFVRTLSACRNLLIYRTFAAREYFDDKGSALTLSQSIENCLYGDNVFDIEHFLSDVAVGDTVLFLGAGDIYDIAKKVISDMGTNYRG